VSFRVENLWICLRSTHRSRDPSSATPVQKIITAEKGIALDLDSLSRDSQIQSKELYQWGQKESSDVKDGWYSNDGALIFGLTVVLQSPIGWLS
jgi:hypothetical protein